MKDYRTPLEREADDLQEAYDRGEIDIETLRYELRQLRQAIRDEAAEARDREWERQP